MSETSTTNVNTPAAAPVAAPAEAPVDKQTPAVAPAAKPTTEDTSPVSPEIQSLQDRLAAAEAARIKAEKAVMEEKKAHSALRKEHMSAEEQFAAEKAEVAQQKKDFAIATNKLAVEKIFTKAGLQEDKYASLLDGIVTEDAEATVEVAKQFVAILETERAAAAMSEKQKLMAEVPAPPVGTPPAQEMSLGAKYAMDYNNKYLEEATQ